MFEKSHAPAWAVALALVVLPAHAATSHNQVQPANKPKATSTKVVKAQLPSKAKKRKAKASSATAPVQYAPSGEAMPARERRLLRECKGRPNAGACLGYAS